MSDKSPDEKDGLFELLKKLWQPIIGFLGAIIFAYNFYKMWLGDQETITYFLAGGGLIVLIIALGWVAFSYKVVTYGGILHIGDVKPQKVWLYLPMYRRVASVLMGVVFAGLFLGVSLYFQQRSEQKDNLIIVIATFDGPEEKYHLRDTIYQQVKTVTQKYRDTTIIPVNDVVTETLGSERAREIGEREQADLVIWAWYTDTKKSSLNLYVENLSPSEFDIAQNGEPYKPEASLADLESLKIQGQIASELTDLVSFLVGYTRYKIGDYSTASTLFNDVLQKKDLAYFIDKGMIYFIAGNCNFFEGNYDLSINNYSNALTINPDSDLAYYNRGVSYSEVGQINLAFDDFSQAIELNPLNAEAYNNRGTIYAHSGAYFEALSDFESAVNISKLYLDDDTEKYYYNRGLIYSNLGQYENAISDYSECLKYAPSLYEGYNNRGLAYFFNSQNEEAIKDFNESIKLNPSDAMVYSNRGNAYSKDKKYDEALRDFNKSLEISPSFSTAFYGRGVMYYEKGNYELAAKDLNQVIALKPNDANAYFYLGKTYFAQNEFDFAITNYTYAIELNPEDFEAYLNRGEIYKMLGKIAEAEADFAKYKELTGQDAP